MKPETQASKGESALTESDTITRQVHSIKAGLTPRNSVHKLRSSQMKKDERGPLPGITATQLEL